MIELAAGLTNVAAGEKLRLERVNERRGRSLVDDYISSAQGKATILQDGDILEVVAVANLLPQGHNHAAWECRKSWKVSRGSRGDAHQGPMLPDKDSLITREYWL